LEKAEDWKLELTVRPIQPLSDKPKVYKFTFSSATGFNLFY